jgi:hypothetical protein
MKRLCLSLLVLLWSAAPAHAQRVGKFSVGVAATEVKPIDDDVRSTVGVGVTLARVPRSGWAFTGALNWFESDLNGAFVGIADKIGTLRVRPLMGGISYTVMQGRLATIFSIVGGPSFNRMHIFDAARDRVEVTSDVKQTSIAVRPGVNLSYAVKPRLAITGFGGYLIDRPKFTFRTAAGQTRNTWKADAVVVSGGLAVSLF